MSALIFLVPAFLACLILTGIHTYLGMHVVARGVIFVDIALAQLAALGLSIGLLWGWEAASLTSYFLALVFAMGGALFFATTDDKKIPQEAVIGVTFAFASAVGILIADKVPHGGEHLKYVLNGNILWVTPFQLIKTAIIYSVLGIVHYKVRHSLWLVSSQPEEAQKQGLKVWRWNLLFYMSFAVVITSSVQMAGILLVFAFLIAPALLSCLITSSFKARLLIGWGIGLCVSVMGLVLSYTFDIPTGATLVTLFGGLVLCAVITRRVTLFLSTQ